MLQRAVLRTQPDGALAVLAAAGSEPAFEAIVHRYRRPLLGYCRRLRLSDNRSEDVVQQTFLNAWGSLRDGTEVRELRPWLYRITHNQAVTMMRGSGRDEIPLTEEIVVMADDVYERQTRLRETLGAVAALPQLQREALLATAVDGLSYDEVAVVLNTSSDAVRGLVYRARNTLRTGVAALSPSPVVVWAANHAGQAITSDNVQQWLTEVTAGGGTLGLSAAAIKGAVVVASSAAVVTGTVGVGLEQHGLSSAGAAPARHAAVRGQRHEIGHAVSARGGLSSPPHQAAETPGLRPTGVGGATPTRIDTAATVSGPRTTRSPRHEWTALSAAAGPRVSPDLRVGSSAVNGTSTHTHVVGQASASPQASTFAGSPSMEGTRQPSTGTGPSDDEGPTTATTATAASD